MPKQVCSICLFIAALALQGKPARSTISSSAASVFHEANCYQCSASKPPEFDGAIGLEDPLCCSRDGHEAMALVQKAIGYRRNSVWLHASAATRDPNISGSLSVGDRGQIMRLTALQTEHYGSARRKVCRHALQNSVSFASQFEVMATNGIASSSNADTCLRDEGVRWVLLPTWNVSDKNKLSAALSLSWVLFSLTLVLWSVWNVVKVPSKNADPGAKIELANDRKAWAEGFSSWISLSWADGLMGRFGKCWVSEVSENEISWDPNARHGIYEPHEIFSKVWSEEVESHGIARVSLLWTIARVVGLKGILALVSACCFDLFMANVAQVVVLEIFLNHITAMSDYEAAHPEEPRNYLETSVLIFVGVFAVPMLYRSAAILTTLLDGYYTQILSAGLVSSVFEKAMSLPAGAAPRNVQDEDEVDEYQNMSPNVIQIINVDVVACFTGLLRSSITGVLSPILIVIMFMMLISRIHFAGFVGFLYCIPALGLTCVLVQVSLALWKRQQGWQDRRLKKLTETLIHIRTLKSLALETLAFEKLNKARQAELDYMQSSTVVGGFTLAIATSIPWGCILLSLYTICARQGSVTVVEILIVQRLMGSLLAAVAMLNGSIRKMQTVPNSFARVKRYMSQQTKPEEVGKVPTDCGGEGNIFTVRGSFSFNKTMPPVLKDLDVEIGQGEIFAVIGSVASGKSAFMQTLLGELFPTKQDAFVVAPCAANGEIAYCSQIPWIFEGTLQDNVVLQSEIDHSRYHQALFAAGLTPDLEVLPGGDQVCIGSNGIRLSGGQRARVALARAAYSSAQTVIIDDPFASVDLCTGAHISEELIFGGIMSGRTRVISMQPDPKRLQCCDRVAIIENGAIVEQGSPENVISSEAFLRIQERSLEVGRIQRKGTGSSWSFGGETVAKICDRKNHEKTELRVAEVQDHITWDTVKWWWRSAGYVNLLVFFSGVLTSRTVELIQSLILATWINKKMLSETNDREFLFLLLVGAMVLFFMQVFTLWAASRVTISASRLIHLKVTDALLHAPVDTFFDKQPVGRLINRLSADMKLTDDAVPWVFSSMLGFTMSFLLTEGYILKTVPWVVMVCALPFVGISLFFAYIYRGTAMPLIFAFKFSMSRIHDMQTMCLMSNVSVRANGMFHDFMGRFNCESAKIIRCAYLSHFVCVAWVQSRIFLCMSVLTTMFATCGLWSGMPIGTLSIIIVLSLGQMAQFEGLSQLLTGALNILNALQRLVMYLNIPKEAPSALASDPVIRVPVGLERNVLKSLTRSGGTKVNSNGHGTAVFLKGTSTPFFVGCPKGRTLVMQQGFKLQDWAMHCDVLDKDPGCYHVVSVNGVAQDAERMAEQLCNPPAYLYVEFWKSGYADGLGIDFQGVTAGYANERSVLHEVSFSIPPRSTAGIVGQTGCGKSTTLLCLLRVLEARSGRILIGGLDCSTLGLTLLRTMIGLVPQDATIFQGTWRYNIDPFNEFPDGRVWDALKCAHLMFFVRNLSKGIDSEITEDGGNLSLGQKQMLSLARMVVRQPPILLLDECTSALDPITQKSLQTTLVSAFPQSTIVSVAHRVSTLMDFDRIITLDQGKVVENGTLKEVLAMKDGIFAKMVRESRV